MNAASGDFMPWKWTRWLMLIALVFALHVGFIFAFGQRKPGIPRAPINVPKLRLVGNDELLALKDPTLFALPNQNDFDSSAWKQLSEISQPTFRWMETPRWLEMPADTLGVAFVRFMQTNSYAAFDLNFKPTPKLSAPAMTINSTRAQSSTLQMAGDLLQRRLLTQIQLPSFTDDDVIAPSRVQALVDGRGNVISVVLLESSGLEEADRQALADARAARFAPANNLTVGVFIFNWQTIPVPTNPPAASP
jgi:TonB family protein